MLNDKGDPLYEEENKVKMTWDPLPDSFIYMDDISCGTKLCKTYKETMDFHFQKLDEILQRLSFHHVKINVNKCEFGKNSILYLGWIISHDFVIPDP